MSADNVLKVLNELTDILDLSDEFTYRELYEQARTYIFNKRMEVQGIAIVTGNDLKDGVVGGNLPDHMINQWRK